MFFNFFSVKCFVFEKQTPYRLMIFARIYKPTLKEIKVYETIKDF